jgi:hypothetical protein
MGELPHSSFNFLCVLFHFLFMNDYSFFIRDMHEKIASYFPLYYLLHFL